MLPKIMRLVEADGYGLGSYTPSISYYLALKPKVEYFESSNGQFSLFGQPRDELYQIYD